MSRAHPTDDLFRTALGALQAGQPARAIALYRELLGRMPGHLLARHYLGVALHQSGDAAGALSWLAETATQQPDNPGFQINLGNALKDLGRLEDAEACYHAALRAAPGHPLAAFNLGQLCEKRGDLSAAADAYRSALTLPQARERLAVLRILDSSPEALGLVGAASDDPDRVQSVTNALLRQAVMLYICAGDRARVLRGLDRLATSAGADVLVALALDLVRQGSKDDAELCFRHALQASPLDPRAAAGVAVLRNEAGYPSEAVALLADCIARGIDHSLVWEACADALKGVGDQAGAARAMERVLQLAPADFAVASSLNLLGLCRSECLAEDLYALANAYGSRLVAAGRSRPTTLPVRHRGRTHRGTDRLRVGILSPDLGLHPVGKFMAGFFRHYPRERLDLIVFNDRPMASDPLADAMRREVGQVIDCHGWNDERLAEAIGRARVDVLLDLAGHTPGNRLPMLAWRVAPRQGTFLGFAGTTGSPGIDFRIADGHTEPAGAEQYSSERLIRMSGSYFCYTPGGVLPPVTNGPLARGEPLTLGCFVQRIKITRDTLSMWLAVLDALPGARMVVRCRSFADPGATAGFLALVAALGGDAGRFALLPWGGEQDYLAQYAGIDIGLNTWPFHQATNLCEALWMGVPTLSVTGREHRGRLGDSILAAAGLMHYACDDSPALVAAARALADDAQGLAETRRTLRQRIEASPLADGRDFAGRLTSALVSI